MKNGIYVSDLDNTLLHENGTLSEYAKLTLNSLLAKGLNFTVASARSISSIKKLLHGLNLKLPVIEFNGAFLTDFNSGEHLFINSINEQIRFDILHLIRMHNKEPFLSTFTGVGDKLYYEKILNEGMSWYVHNRMSSHDQRLTKTNEIKNHINEEVVCFTVIDTKAELIDLKNIIEEKYKHEVEIHFIENQYSKDWFWLTIHDIRATKDKAILELIGMYDFDLQHLTVFGDNDNDITMFKLAPRSIAVSSATAELKKYATTVIGSNNEDSVVKYLINEFNNNQP